MRVCAIQMDVKKGDRGANQAAVRLIAEKAVRLCSPEVIVLPELWSTGYELEDAEALEAEQRDAAFLGSLAEGLGLSFAGGSVLARRGESFFNRAQYIDSAGRYAAFYDKMHLFRLMGEDRFLAPGQQALLFDMGNLRCASVICYDIRFCELPRSLAVQGAELLFVSAQWPRARVDHWRTLLKARAIENQMFVVACNRCGVTEGTEFAGHSAIIAPDGAVLAEAGMDEEIIWADVDREDVHRTRNAIPVFMDRVPDRY